MKEKLFKRVTSLLSAAAMLLTYADFSAIDFSVHAENGDEAPELVSYDVNGNGKIDDGEENWGYELDSADDLFWFADKVHNDYDNFGNANAFLAEDITVNSGVLDEDGELNEAEKEHFREWTPVGAYNEENSEYYIYSGTFDGNNRTISGLYYNESDATYVGLFGLNFGTIENVTVTDSYFCGSGYVCGICGYNKGTIENCSNTGKVVGCYYVGGVCGENYYGTIEKCYNSGDVTATNEYAYVGGVCGHKSSGTISNCYNTGDVTATGEYAYVGGVCGKNYDTISNCYNTGDITATGDEAYVGGVCGGNNDGSISNCSNTGDVSGSDDVGGICGNNYLGEISNCYNTGDVTGTGNYVGGVCGDNFQSEISNCYNTGDVTGTGNYVGGVCGDNFGTITNCYNTGDVTPTGDAAYVGGVCGYNEECIITNCYYLNTVAEDLYATAMTAQQFASGEVCWLLNGGENQAETPVFFQNIGTDDLPVLDSTHGTVYKNTACDSVSDYYNNENKDQEHSYENGFCTVCDGYEPATDLNNDGVYEISNAGQLYWFAGLVNGTLKNINQIRYAHAVLTNDITVNSCVLDEDGELNEGDFRAWTPIGNISSKYSGTFDGAGYTISGLYFNDSGADYVGLFGANSRTIKNVIVADSYFYGNSKVGGICGSNSNKNGKIENCYNTAKVSGSNFVGGVCGFNYQATISNCFNTGNISAEEYVGGVCGYNQNKSTILNCYNTGKVSGSNYVGGISGENSDINLITNCYNTGKVEGSTDVGGICGNNCIDCRVTNCYYLEVDGLNGINGNKTSAEVTAKNETDFASGEVCWLLNGGETQAETPVFFQNIDKEAFPVLDSKHGRVYLTTNCVVYSNTDIGMKNHSPESKKKDATCTEDGHSEYWYCKDCGKYFSDADCSEKIESIETWMSENAIPATGHRYIDGICENCGAFEDGIGARLAGCSISLDGSIGVNFYMQLAEEVLEDETAYILFTLPNGETSEIRVSDAKRTSWNGVEYCVFKCNVAATEMTDTITAQIKTSSGNGTEYSYTVKEYADYLLAHTADNAKYAEAEDLVRAMLNYGAYAQTFKKYNTDILPCEPSDVSEYVISEHEYTASAGIKVEFAGANLSMLSNTTLRLFFEADDINGVTIMYDAEALEIGENNGLNFVEIKNIAPQNLNNDFTVEVNDNGKIFNVTYSPMTYCYQVSQTSNDAALVNLVKAIAMYNDAAEAYFKEVKV